jgi:hypothetical protein
MITVLKTNLIIENIPDFTAEINEILEKIIELSRNIPNKIGKNQII